MSEYIPPVDSSEQLDDYMQAVQHLERIVAGDMLYVIDGVNVAYQALTEAQLALRPHDDFEDKASALIDEAKQLLRDKNELYARESVEAANDFLAQHQNEFVVTGESLKQPIVLTELSIIDDARWCGIGVETADGTIVFSDGTYQLQATSRIIEP